ncbi:hypothetical protein FSP39_019767 [Pinctada imbricata]|uniref:Disease resistance R13L4/SHOC-2-like LRR domain-containing protein n=1 Tax=Pinctada imbricata TaxID=66713 RepID=A0AA88XUP2_PINIB|nr:hypothetical protein FSP39_019767 [Pinctada imbricata]
MKLPEALGTLHDLEILSADDNQLSDIPSDVSGLRHIQQLSLSKNAFTKFPVSVCSLKTLEILDLRKNEIPEIPSRIAELDRLTSLYMGNNVVNNFIPELCGMTELQLLDLANNIVEEIPEAISQMTGLEDLDISHNRFLEFPKSVLALEKLERLTFDQSEGHPVPSLPDEIEFSNLSYLIVSNNTLRTLPNTINGMKNIKSIVASFNEISILPKSICDLTQIEILHLNDNKLTSLPENFDRLSNLKDLRLHNNPLRTPPMDVCVSGVVQPIGRFIRRAVEREDILMLKMFDILKVSMNKHELRYLLKKFRFPDEKISELDQMYHGKDKLPDRIYNALLFWREFKGPMATYRRTTSSFPYHWL